jgi:hypothetical protein
MEAAWANWFSVATIGTMVICIETVEIVGG